MMDLPKTESVLTAEINKVGILTLNRPKVLNAANYEMVEKVFVTLNKWQNTKSMIIIKGSGNKAFCSGSDLKKLIEPNEYDNNLQFFKIEYTINYMIANLKVPYLSLIDGIIMGGGVGYSIHGKYRIATERTVFAMPETKIGAMPDIGSSYFLPRLQGKLGYYLGLTGSKLKGIDALYGGIATHYCDSSRIAQLEKALINLENVNKIENILDEYCPKIESEFSLAKYLPQINKCFNASKIEEILSNLEDDNTEWARETIKILRTVSPTSLKLTLHQLQLGANYSLGECLQMEYQLVHRILKHGDFIEGVSALLIRKDNKPKWSPARIEDVIFDKHVIPFFEPLPNNDELLPITVKLASKF